MMHKSQIWKIDTYDWFCAPGSHILIKGSVFIFIIFVSLKKFSIKTHKELMSLQEIWIKHLDSYGLLLKCLHEL